MVLPLATTTFTIHRLKVLVADVVTRDPYGAGYGTATDGPGPQDPAAYEVVRTRVRGTVTAPGGSERDVGGSQERVNWSINLDPCDIRHDDEVTDEQTLVRYRVSWVVPRKGLGLDHVTGSVRTVKGEA
jgi:hypothetical protein